MPPFLDLSHTDKPRQIQASLIAYMRMFAGLPGMALHDNDSFWFISNKPAPGDIILRANWLTGDPEQHIDDTLAQISQHTDAIGWFVFPSDQPADLNQRLEARGMPSGRAGNWLWADLTALASGPAMPDDFRIERVRDDIMLAEWAQASEAGFDNDDLDCFYDAYARHGYGPESFSLHYTAYLGNTPVATGTILDAGGSAAIYDLSTVPTFRQRGFGAALTHALMQTIRSRGYADTWIWSSDMATSVYRKLGYVDADFGLREHKWFMQGEESGTDSGS